MSPISPLPSTVKMAQKLVLPIAYEWYIDVYTTMLALRPSSKISRGPKKANTPATSQRRHSRRTTQLASSLIIRSRFTTLWRQRFSLSTSRRRKRCASRPQPSAFCPTCSHKYYKFNTPPKGRNRLATMRLGAKRETERTCPHVQRPSRNGASKDCSAVPRSAQWGSPSKVGHAWHDAFRRQPSVMREHDLPPSPFRPSSGSKTAASGPSADCRALGSAGPPRRSSRRPTRRSGRPHAGRSRSHASR
jgi:hypothetical protein